MTEVMMVEGEELEFDLGAVTKEHVAELSCTDSDAIKFVTLTLAAFRLARLLVVDAGPGDVLLRFRTWLGVYSFNQNGQQAGGTIARLFSCSHCIGFWVALLLALIFYGRPKALLMWLAIAGGQSFLQSIAKGK